MLEMIVVKNNSKNNTVSIIKSTHKNKNKVGYLTEIGFLKEVKKNPQEHKNNKFKLFGGQATAYIVLAFFAFVFILLFFSDDTRAAIFISPFWFIFLYFYYKKYKNNAKELAEKQKLADKKHTENL